MSLSKLVWLTELNCLSDELTTVVQREGDRIISALNAGPHERIIDPVSLALSGMNLTDFGHRMSTKSGKKW